MEKTNPLRLLFRKVYQMIPLRKQIFSVLRPVLTIPKKYMQYLHFEGEFTFDMKGKKIRMYNYGFRYHVENEMFWGGMKNGWEKVSIDIWSKLCEEGKVIFDIGSNTGLFSLISWSVNPKAEIYAFEPLPRIMDKLKRNVELNGFSMNLCEEALSNYNGTASLFPTSLDHVYSVTVNEDHYGHKEKTYEIKVKTERLDSFIERNQIKGIDFIKLDVETHEFEVLEGMGVYLQQFKPDLLIEIQNDEIGRKVSELIAGIDYDFFNIDEAGSIRKTNGLEKSDYFNFLVCKKETTKRLGLK